jgi:prevent-host-death family protein
MYYTNMEQFSTSDLVRNIGDVTHAARRTPILITLHNKPRFVMMTIEAYELMCGRKAKKVELVQGADE